jgi:hypothetical protein
VLYISYCECSKLGYVHICQWLFVYIKQTVESLVLDEKLWAVLNI